jgi:hypothetical protein
MNSSRGSPILGSDDDVIKIYMNNGGHLAARSGRFRTSSFTYRAGLFWSVRFGDGCEPLQCHGPGGVVELTSTVPGDRVTGALIGRASTSERCWGADLVVDAMGRCTHQPSWGLGYGRR